MKTDGKIKKDGLMNKENILVFIGARSGSKGVKGKNIRPILGKPLIAYTIETALAWGRARRVIVSTDSQEYACIARAYGAEVPFLRPKRLATDWIPKGPAIRHALEYCERHYKERYEIVVDLDVTAPIRTIKDLDNCLHLFKRYRPKTLFSVVEANKNPYFNMVEVKEDCNVDLVRKPDKRIYGRQRAPKVYSMNASIYFYDRDYVHSSKDLSPFSDKTRIYVMDDEVAGIDIDREIDFKFTEFLMKDGFMYKKFPSKVINYLERFALHGKVAFVCGGAGLLGAEISKALASAGAFVIVLDINRKIGLELVREINEAGYQARFEYFDMADFSRLDQEIQRLSGRYRSMDIWVNVAYPRTKDWESQVESVRVSSLRKNVDMHLNTYAWISRNIALIMSQRGIPGSIVNFSSIYGLQGNDFTIYEGTNFTSPMAYSMIKAGILNVSRYLASYFGPNNIRINTICPGGVFNYQDRVLVRQYSQRVPLKRMAHLDEVAAATLFLASDAASYITGATFVVDGGWTIV